MTGMLLDAGALALLGACAVCWLASVAQSHGPSASAYDCLCAAAEACLTVLALITAAFSHAGVKAWQHGLQVSHCGLS